MPLYQDDQGGLFLSGGPGWAVGRQRVKRNPPIGLRVRAGWRGRLSWLALLTPLLLLLTFGFALNWLWAPPPRMAVAFGFLAAATSWSVLLWITCEEVALVQPLRLAPRQPVGLTLLELLIPWCAAIYGACFLAPHLIEAFDVAALSTWLLMLVAVLLMAAPIIINVRLIRYLNGGAPGVLPTF